MTTPQPPPLLLTIRFSASLPDLELDIPRPSATTIVSLKHLIRSRLDKAHARRRLRFIHGGKILPDTSVLTSVLRVLPPPPSPNAFPVSSPRDPHHDDDEDDNNDERGKTKTKAKGRARDKGKSVPGRPEPSARIYVNCSIGDELSQSDLDHEAAAAALPPRPPASPFPIRTTGTATTPTTNTTTTASSSSTTTTTSAPRGFERLLSAGFNASEVNQLRLQFRSIHASRYTPDTLPSPDGFRRLEDAWIDDNGAAVPAAAVDASADGVLGMAGGGGEEVGLVGMVDVLIRGVITGFIWPLGSAGWLIREEGMSSDRWRFMVGVGVIFSVLIGFIRAISGDK
ncbi:DUF2407 C-terminal domain-containing protein [Nemania sp. NC0429]|nr:DUF2407 C-terminal domain-containing protein [Nemania sp. NC0429]